MEAWVAGHPELLAERDAVRSLSRSIRQSVPESVEPPYPDFFNTRILRAIEEEEPAAAPSAAPKGAGFFKWLVAPLAAGAMAVCFYLGTQVGQDGAVPPPGANTASAASTVYAPDSRVEADIFVANNQEATVIVLEGLDDIPDDLDMAGDPSAESGGSVMVSTETVY